MPKRDSGMREPARLAHGGLMRPADTVHAKALAKLEEAERKAWLSLAGYKFLMFGYWAAQWVLCKGLLPEHHRNPFAGLVRIAKTECETRGWRDRENDNG